MTQQQPLTNAQRRYQALRAYEASLLARLSALGDEVEQLHAAAVVAVETGDIQGANALIAAKRALRDAQGAVRAALATLRAATLPTARVAALRA